MKAEISRRNVLLAGGMAAFGAMARRAGAAEVSGEAAKGQEDELLAGGFKDGKYVLPPLPYDFKALEPTYDERTLKIHYTKHHAAYVNGLNETLGNLAMARKASDYSAVKALCRNLAFNGSGHVLHCLFWQSMKPGGSEMAGTFAKDAERDFGSVAAAKAEFAAAAKAVEGSGWAVLAYEPIAKKLLTLQAEKHQNLAIWGVKPLLVCDVWEHAYYLQYANDRGAWVDNFMKLANWEFAAKRLEKVK